MNDNLSADYGRSCDDEISSSGRDGGTPSPDQRLGSTPRPDEGLSAESVRVSIDPVQAVTCWTCDQDGLLIGIPETYDEALRLRANHLKSHHNDGGASDG